MAAQCDVLAVDLTGEDRHPLVVGGAAAERRDTEVREVDRLDQLRKDLVTVERGVRRVVPDRSVVGDETDEPGVFHPVALGGSTREEDSLGDVDRRRERRAVVRRRQPVQHSRGLARDRSLDVVVLERDDRRFEFGHRELVLQPDEDSLLDVVQHFHVTELRGEEALVIRMRCAVAGDRVVAGRVESDRSIGPDDPGAELDRRPVPLPDCTQAHDEANGARFDAGLIGSGDHRGVPERRCFDRVLVREVRADQMETVQRQLGIDQFDLIEPSSDDARVPLERGVEVAMATDEVLTRCVQRLGDFVLGHRHDPLEDDLQA